MSSSALSAAGSSVVRACGRRAGRRVSLVSVAMSTTKTLSTLDKRCCFSSMTASSLTASTSSSSSSSSALLPLTRRFATQTAGKSATAATTTFQKYPFLAQLDLSEHNLGAWNGNEWVASGEVMKSINPATGEVIATVQAATAEDYESCIRSMDRAKQQWMAVPTPVRGDLLRKLSAALSKHKDALGALISLEMGKILSEGKGEVQEAIDICDHAAGLSRSLNGQVIPSERRNHMILEQWHPLKGHVGVISAFNFPCAVYFWNLALSLVCGNTNIWKGSESTNLVSIACTKIVNDVVRDAGYDGGLVCLVQGTGKEIGARLVADPRVELISFTGSERVGREVAGVVASRFGKQILELGGNNAMVVMDDADLSMCLRSVLFSAVGTAGQRCTTLRRLYLHDSVYDSFVASLTKAYRSIPIGDPMASSTLCGPLHTPSAVDAFVRGVARAQAEGGRVLIGGKALPGPGNFVEPTIIEVPTSAPCVQVELFAPVLYVMRISSLEEGIQLNNDVPQGLSSALFSKSPQNIARWTSAFGSDCGLVNVNLGTSGAEIGGAFGGEKSTGGGRESGSDCWKQYCRRTTSVINNGTEMPLAQGVQFDV